MPGSKQKRPLASVLESARRIKALLNPVCQRIEIAGSIRRQKPEVGDIELVAIPRLSPETDLFGKVQGQSRNDLWVKLDEFSEDPKLGIHYTKRGDKYRQFTLPFEGSEIQVDLFTCVADNWGWIFLVRTGSADFSHHMAGCLNGQGYTSRGGHITHVVFNKRMVTETEEAVFKLARQSFRDPSKRSW